MKKEIENLIGYGEEFISQFCYDAIKEETRIHIKHIITNGISVEEAIFIITNVRKIFFDTNGNIPNDLEKLDIIPVSDGFYKFIFYAVVFEENKYIHSTITILGKDAYLVDAQNPNIVII